MLPVLCPLFNSPRGTSVWALWDPDNQGHFASQALRALLKGERNIDGSFQAEFGATGII